MADYVSGLDLGRAAEFTALAALEKETRSDDTGVYSLRHLERFERHCKYSDIVAAVKGRWARPPLAGSALVVDQTGVGRSVFDLIKAADVDAALYRVTLTGGDKHAKEEDGLYRVPKKELVTALQVMLQTGRLRIASGLKHAATLQKELLTFRAKIGGSNESLGDWREGAHDDLVLAVALAVWAGENVFIGTWDATPHPTSRSVVHRASPWAFQAHDDDDEDYDDAASRYDRREGGGGSGGGLPSPWQW